MLGAVDEGTTELAGGMATVLTLTYLKPGVARADVLLLARELGLNDIILY
jgi:rare lipoprotein A